MRVNILQPVEVMYDGENYYIERHWFHNEFSKHVDLYLYCDVTKVTTVDRTKWNLLSDRISVLNLFTNNSPLTTISQYRYLSERIRSTSDLDNDIYFVFYPYHMVGVLLTKIINPSNLVLWIKSDFISLMRVADDSWVRSQIKKVAIPLVSWQYKRHTQNLIDDTNNTIFYTADILYDDENHINQHEILSLSPLNRNKNLISTTKSNNIVFVGTESKQKGLSLLLSSLSRVSMDLNLTVIGTDSITNQSKYDFSINCVGRVYDREKFYQILSQHDCLVMPSYAEKQGKVQIEAMSAGVVPICSDSGGTHQTMKNYYNGLFFEEGSVDSLVNSIEEIYRSDMLYESLLENGLRFTDNIDIADQIHQMSSIIKNKYQ